MIGHDEFIKDLEEMYDFLKEETIDQMEEVIPEFLKPVKEKLQMLAEDLEKVDVDTVFTSKFFSMFNSDILGQVLENFCNKVSHVDETDIGKYSEVIISNLDKIPTFDTISNSDNRVNFEDEVSGYYLNLVNDRKYETLLFVEVRSSAICNNLKKRTAEFMMIVAYGLFIKSLYDELHLPIRDDDVLLNRIISNPEYYRKLFLSFCMFYFEPSFIFDTAYNALTNEESVDG